MDKREALTCIQEENEVEEDNNKWVPKKKHEVLKAKYKCLKKLFQLYDANIIGLFPDTNINNDEIIEPKKRRQRSHRTKTDAGAGTTGLSSGDLTQFIHDRKSVTITTINSSVTKTHVEVNPSEMEADSIVDTCFLTTNDGFQNESSINTLDLESKSDKYVETTNFNVAPECQCQYLIENKMSNPYPFNPYYLVNKRRKPTRFQCFLLRILGIRRSYTSSGENTFTASDGYFNRDRRRRRGVRFRKLRRAKKIKSESDLKMMGNPSILTCVQSVQRNCLLDKTPRQCPIVGCQMISYGIINYNDHLNLCHFKNRKYICHYCHEGFETDREKITHENQHLGINALGFDVFGYQIGGENNSKTANITQTDPEHTIPNEKLKQIVSFFEKLNSADYATENNTKESDSNLASTSESVSVNSEIKIVNCMSVKKFRTSSDSSTNVGLIEASSQFGGENFKFKRPLSSNQLEQERDQLAKFNSSSSSKSTRSILSYEEDGRVVYQSRSNSCLRDDGPSVQSICKTDITSSPSTNVVYFPFVKKPSVVDSVVNKVLHMGGSYKWESVNKNIKT